MKNLDQIREYVNKLSSDTEKIDFILNQLLLHFMDNFIKIKTVDEERFIHSRRNDISNNVLENNQKLLVMMLYPNIDRLQNINFSKSFGITKESVKTSINIIKKLSKKYKHISCQQID